MEGGRLYPLGMIRPFELKDQRELEAFIRQYFPSAIPGFALLEADAWWGECPVDLVGRDLNRLGRTR